MWATGEQNELPGGSLLPSGAFQQPPTSLRCHCFVWPMMPAVLAADELPSAQIPLPPPPPPTNLPHHPPPPPLRPPPPSRSPHPPPPPPPPRQTSPSLKCPPSSECTLPRFCTPSLAQRHSHTVPSSQHALLLECLGVGLGVCVPGDPRLPPPFFCPVHVPFLRSVLECLTLPPQTFPNPQAVPILTQHGYLYRAFVIAPL